LSPTHASGVSFQVDASQLDASC